MLLPYITQRYIDRKSYSNFKRIIAIQSPAKDPLQQYSLGLEAYS